MLLTVVAMFINTRRVVPIRKGDNTTNIMDRDILSNGNDEVSVSMDKGPHGEEIIVVKKAQPFGYQMSFNFKGENITKWSQKIGGKYLCGYEDFWYLSMYPTSSEQTEISVKGFFTTVGVTFIPIIILVTVYLFFKANRLSEEVFQNRSLAYASVTNQMVDDMNTFIIETTLAQNITVIEKSCQAIKMNAELERQLDNPEKAKALDNLCKEEQTKGKLEAVKASIASMMAYKESKNEKLAELNNNLFEAGALQKRAERLSLAGKILMPISILLAYTVAFILVHIILKVLGAPTSFETVNNMVCYYLDTSELPAGFTLNTSLEIPEIAQTASSPNNATRARKIAEFYENHRSLRQQMATGVESLPTATIVYLSDTTAQVTSDCEQAWIETASGKKMIAYPSTYVECTPVSALKVGTKCSRTKEKCNDNIGIFKFVEDILSDANTVGSPVDADVTWSMVTTLQGGCDKKTLLFFKTKGNQQNEWSLGIDAETSDEWEYCTISSTQSKLVIVDDDGNPTGEELPDGLQFYEQLTVDPRTSRQYGWYTNGNEEIVVTATFNNGLGSDLLFGEYAEYSGDNLKNLLFTESQDYFKCQDSGCSALRMTGLEVKPSSFQCRMQYVIEGIDKIEAKNTDCTQVTAENIEGNYLTFTTNSENSCQFSIGFGDGSEEKVITISKDAPISYAGATTWRCASSTGGTGHSCTAYQTTPHVPINATYKSSSRTPSVYNNGTEVVSASSEIKKSEFDLSFDSVFSLFSSPVFQTIFIVAGVVFAVIILYYIIRKGGCISCKRETSPIVVQPQIQQAPQVQQIQQVQPVQQIQQPMPIQQVPQIQV